jgi:hypothetical protein
MYNWFHPNLLKPSKKPGKVNPTTTEVLPYKMSPGKGFKEMSRDVPQHAPERDYDDQVDVEEDEPVATSAVKRERDNEYATQVSPQRRPRSSDSNRARKREYASMSPEYVRPPPDEDDPFAPFVDPFPEEEVEERSTMPAYSSLPPEARSRRQHSSSPEPRAQQFDNSPSPMANSSSESEEDIPVRPREEITLRSDNEEVRIERDQQLENRRKWAEYRGKFKMDESLALEARRFHERREKSQSASDNEDDPLYEPDVKRESFEPERTPRRNADARSKEREIRGLLDKVNKEEKSARRSRSVSLGRHEFRHFDKDEPATEIPTASSTYFEQTIPDEAAVTLETRALFPGREEE